MNRSLAIPSLFLVIAAGMLVAGMLPQTSLGQSAPVNVALGEPGVLPTGENGEPLNLDFETGTLDDWTAEGEAFGQQPIHGDIDPKRPFGADKRSDKTGEYWIGGFEKLQDTPTGRLTSKPFAVTHPFASFLVAGGAHAETRVELVRVDGNEVFFSISGQDAEGLRPVVVDLKDVQGKSIFIRLVDEHTGGWGHINFDDFRFHGAPPRFARPELVRRQAPAVEQLYPHAGLSAAEAAKVMEVPDGFRVQVAACEPEVQQPIALAIDDRGRLWIAEAYEYPRRAPEGKGRDRILIFEDTDLDGQLDRRTVFADGLNLVSGLEVGFGGVWVGAAPEFLFIPDRNGDDRPDGPPEVLLDGWGHEDTHETLNTFIWGPDGWLYGCHGVFTHSRVGKPGTPADERTPINAGIWRYHPTKHRFEVFAEGTSNPWGVDFNDRGQAFATACVIPHLFHVIQGARYERQAGSHFNKHTYEDIKTIADHRHYTGNQWNNNDRRESDELGGGHAHAGAMVYLGGAWPEEYHDRLFMHNIHGNRTNVDILRPDGSGFIGSHGPDFLRSRDQWSQMLNLRYGPDGQVWTIDWYDKNQCHRVESEVHDRSNGRIYRISYQGAEPVSVNLRDLSDEELVALQLRANDWYVRHSRRILQERAAAGALSDDIRLSLLDLALSGDDEPRALRGLWAFHVIGGDIRGAAEKLLKSPHAHVRAWTIQFLAEDAPAKLSPEVGKRLAEMAQRDPSPVVRLYLASAVPRLAVNDRWALVEQLVQHSEDAADHNLPLMYWYALEPLAAVDARRALALAMGASERIPILAQFMIQRIGSSADDALSLLLTGLRETPGDADRLLYLRGMNESLRGRRQVKAPEGWQEILSPLKAAENVDLKLAALSLALTFGDPAAANELRGVLANSKEAVTRRRQALTSLVKAKDSPLPELLISLLDDAELRPDSLRALAAFEHPRTAEVLLARYESLGPAERRDALTTLCSRVSFAKELISAVEAKKVPAGHLSADLVRQLQNLRNQELDEQVARVWGSVRETAEDKKALLADLTERLTPAAIAAGDAPLGRAVFAKTCQQCHTLFGTGGKVGPDLTGSNRRNLEYLLSNIVDPSAVMAKEYQPSILETADGRVITGIVRASDATSLTVQTPNELLVLPRDEIEDVQVSKQSMMPENLLQPLNANEVQALVSYLGSGGQVPLLATPENAISFFNGKNLEGWRGDAKLWSVEDGEIVGRSPGLKHNAFLVSELAVEDFNLTFEVRLRPDSENSGVQFRSEPQADGEVRGYQADIGAGWWGKLYEELGRGLLWTQSGEQHVRTGEWNRYEIVAEGHHITTRINGQLCVDLDDPKGARRGVIGFQLHSGGPLEVRFRNLQLEVLGTQATTAASAGDSKAPTP